jgi:hypothetical protein
MQEGCNLYAYNCENLKYYVHIPDLRDDIIILGWNPRTISQHNGTYSEGPGGSVDALNKRGTGAGFLTAAGDASLRHIVQDGSEVQRPIQWVLGTLSRAVGKKAWRYTSPSPHTSLRCGA